MVLFRFLFAPVLLAVAVLAGPGRPPIRRPPPAAVDAARGAATAMSQPQAGKPPAAVR